MPVPLTEIVRKIDLERGGGWRLSENEGHGRQWFDQVCW